MKNQHSNSRPNASRSSNREQQRQNNQPENPAEKKLPPTYVDQAERVMQALSTSRPALTTSKIRNILSRISDIYNKEVKRTEETLAPENQAELQMVRVRIAYECGREEAVRQFVEKSELLNYIKGVGNSRVEFICFARYMEALVAYHRFFGGKDS